ncbi:SDR family oxidoreductase [Amycolatopsis sp. cmx-8-4]|uniref:SDR family oxidoreductase n=1 Tax=Amycolatopsis sp. cmx-8-4 TaxID=2790947 RepID=UPI00397A6771
MIVTGGSAGIGLALVQLLVKRGVDVVVLDRQPCPVRSVQYVEVDIADEYGLASVIAGLPAEIGGLANVAGLPGTADPVQVLATNLLAPMRLTRSLLTRMSRGCSVVNVSSISAGYGALPEFAQQRLLNLRSGDDLAKWLREHPLTGGQAYRISKRAVSVWSGNLAAEVVGRGVRVNCVSPGPVDTDILNDFKASMGNSAIDRAERILGRHARPEEIAEVIAFLLVRQPQCVTLRRVVVMKAATA